MNHRFTHTFTQIFKSPNSKSKSPNSSKKQSQQPPSSQTAIKTDPLKKKIPLISRRPGSSEKDKKPNKNSKPKNPEDASPPPPEDADEKLIFDAFKNANSFVTALVQTEQAAVTATELKTGDVPPPEESKGKGRKQSIKPPSAAGKGKSPKGAKGAPPPAVVSSEGPSEEDKEKQAALEKRNKEYMFALKKEGLIIFQIFNLG